MPRVIFVKKARKDYPDHDIKKGESYYWWKFRFGTKQFSKTPPKPSQLTQSEFLQNLYDLEEQIGNFSADNQDDLEAGIEDFKSQIEQLRDECQEHLDNMPEQLQESDSGQMLRERIDGLESWLGELDNVDCSIEVEGEEDSTLTEEEKEEAKQEMIRQRAEEIVEEIHETANNHGIG